MTLYYDLYGAVVERCVDIGIAGRGSDSHSGKSSYALHIIAPDLVRVKFMNLNGVITQYISISKKCTIKRKKRYAEVHGATKVFYVN